MPGRSSPFSWKRVQSWSAARMAALAARLAAGQLVGCHAGRAVQKAHVVVVHLDLVLDPVQKAVHQRQRGLFERRIAGALIAQPDLARPEAAGPLVVLALGVDVVDTGVVLAVVGIQRQVLAHQRGGGVQGLFGLCLGQDMTARARLRMVAKRNQMLPLKLSMKSRIWKRK